MPSKSKKSNSGRYERGNPENQPNKGWSYSGGATKGHPVNSKDALLQMADLEPEERQYYVEINGQLYNKGSLPPHLVERLEKSGETRLNYGSQVRVASFGPPENISGSDGGFHLRRLDIVGESTHGEVFHPNEEFTEVQDHQAGTERNTQLFNRRLGMLNETETES